MNAIVRAATLCCMLVSFVPNAARAQRGTPFQVVHPSGAAQDQFGTSVAILGDTMIVGAPLDDIGGGTNQGSAHIYRWTNAGWTLEASLAASDGLSNDSFGYSVAIGRDTVIVGAYAGDVGSNTDQGSAYVFVRSGTTWNQQQKLTASDGVAHDYFGWSVAITGDTAVVGRYLGEGGNTDPGAAYVFVRSAAGVWTQQARLIASDRLPGDAFGYSVAISSGGGPGAGGDTVAVGAIGDDSGGGQFQGSAYLFFRAMGGTTWTQQGKVVAADGAAFDNFGISVALGEGGDTVAVGAYADDFLANTNQGSVYVFGRPAGGSTWSMQQKLVSIDGAANNFFGISVALSGSTMLVGAYAQNVGGLNTGAAHVFTKLSPTIGWVWQARLNAPDSAGNDDFGFSVSLSGDLAAVGALGDNIGGNSAQGSAWVFSRVGSAWIGPDFHLIASDGAAFDELGTAVAISGNLAVVGAPLDTVGSNTNQGSAYVFARIGPGSAWTQQAKLVASDGFTGDNFGVSVGISADTIVVGANEDDISSNVNQGSAYVFVSSGTTWTQQAKLVASDAAANDNFGYSVAISGNTIVAGAYFDDVGANADQGSAYVFTRSGATWTQQQKLTAPDGAASDYFGVAVAISSSSGGDTAVVGAYGDDNGANTNQGSAYVFTRPSGGTTWSQQAKLTAFDGATNDLFGNAVAISGDTIVVGEEGDDLNGNTDQGSAYIFTRPAGGTGWSLQAKLVASDGGAADLFGISVAIAGDTAVVGAYLDDVGANADQGSAYVFTRAPGGTAWTQTVKLTAPDGATGDSLGIAVAIAGDTAVVGAWGDTVGSNAFQGSAYTFDVPVTDLSLARIDAYDATYLTLSAAMLQVQSGQQLTVTDGAFRGISTIDTLGRSLALVGAGDIRTPPGSSLTLGGSSTLSAAAGSTVEIYGQLLTSSLGSATVTGSALTIGSRGMLTVHAGSSLTVNAASSSLESQVRLEQGATLNFSGGATSLGPMSAFSGSVLTAGGTLTNLDTFSLTAGTISAPLFWNRETANIFGSSAVFGSYTNEIGAVTTIRSGALFVFGTLTNNGTIIGTICSNCVGTPPNLDVGGTLALGPGASLSMPFNGSVVHVGGSFDCAIDSSTRFDMSLATLQLEGTGAEQTLEVMSRDVGAVAAGLDPAGAGSFPIGVLRIGPSPSTVRLVDARDNDGLGQAPPGGEAVYVDQLLIDAGSRLINTTCRIYYNTLVNNGVVDVPANLVRIPPPPPPCPADYDHDGQVTPSDIAVFVTTWSESLQQGTLAGDFNGDGAVTPLDIAVFINAWFSALAHGC